MSDYSFPSSDGPVLVIGAAGVDIIGRIKNELQPKTSNQALVRISFGGVARNVAENLARLGQPVTLLTAVGEDQAGDNLLAQAQAAGVHVGNVMRCAECPTGVYIGVIDSKGELELAVDDMRVVTLITPEYLKEHAQLFKQASLVFLDANLSKESLRTAISLARRGRVPVCADPAAVTLAHRLLPHLSRFYLITPNSAEAGVLCNRTVNDRKRREAMQAAKYLVAQGVEIVIITLAEFGVVYATSETSGHIPAIHTQIADPTGAGDALTAAVIFALLNEIPLDDALRLGVSSASLTLRYPGTVLPDLSQEKLYDQLVI